MTELFDFMRPLPIAETAQPWRTIHRRGQSNEGRGHIDTRYYTPEMLQEMRAEIKTTLLADSRFPIAAAVFEHYVEGSGQTFQMPVEAIRNSNDGRDAEQMVEDDAARLMLAQCIRLACEGAGTRSGEIRQSDIGKGGAYAFEWYQEPDLFAASGKFDLRGALDARASVGDSIASVYGDMIVVYSDTYHWHPTAGLRTRIRTRSASLILDGHLFDDADFDALKLIGAADFDMTAQWTLRVSESRNLTELTQSVRSKYQNGGQSACRDLLASVLNDSRPIYRLQQFHNAPSDLYRYFHWDLDG